MLKFVVLAFLLSFSAFAHAECEQQCTDDGTLIIKLSAGKGVIESPLSREDDIEFSFLPSVSFYYGDFFIENAKLGYNLASESNVTLDVVGKVNRDGIYYVGDDIVAGFATGGLLPGDEPFEWPNPDAKLSYLGGLESKVYTDNDIFHFGVYTDISGVHEGQEADFSWTRIWLDGDIKLSTEFGGTYKSIDTLNYYYGYPLTGSRVNFFAKVDVAYPITEQFWLVGNYHGEKLSDAIRSSEAVDKEDLHSFFIGVTWVLGW